MTGAFGAVLPFLAIPVVATALGGVIAAFFPPSERLQSFFQHFAAGVVMAAVAGEVLPEVNKLHDSLGIVVGFASGVALLLVLERVLGGLEGREDGPSLTERAEGATPRRAFPTVLVVVVGVDVLIDGLLLGSSFGAGERLGQLLTVALTVELLFLGLSTAAALVRGGAERTIVIAAVGVVALALAVGALVGAGLLAGLTGFWLEVVLSFGAAALLYLVVEELLTEAHAVTETPVLTASFFVGFLALYLFETFL